MNKRKINWQKCLLILMLLFIVSCVDKTKNSKQTENKQQAMEYNKLTPDEERVILRKGTDIPFTGDYYTKKDSGIYICRRCNAPLYNSADKFDSHCGWPSFDDEIPGAVKRVDDADGMRTEIICTNCGAHLGHVFLNEGFTSKETRHCVNTSSIRFIPADSVRHAPPVIHLK
jgi:peptide methionine sulfoxide reductase msrA/msrB